jgi:dTDP-4-amino-4,6-dideoxygalactose transaminase
MLRIKGISETQRDQIIDVISKSGVGVNVHYIPMPMLTLFKSLGYNIEDFPNTYNLYQNEITLPVYNGLTIEMVNYVIDVVVDSIQKSIQ